MSFEALHPHPSGNGPSGNGPALLPGAADEVDPDLLALPPPPRGERRLTLAMLVLVSFVATAMAYALRSEAAYAWAPAGPADVGDLYTLDASKAESNRYVRGHGALGAALAVRFERPFESDTYRVSPVMGRNDLWVEVRVPAGDEGARYVPPATFSGRLVRWRDSGLRHRGLSSAVGLLTHEAVPDDAWLLVDGEPPSSARWTFGLLALFVGFAAWSLATVARLVRPVR